MRFFREILLTFVVSCVLAGCSTPSRISAPDAELAALMSERLALARHVARSKHHSGAPIHDPAREAAILANLTAQAVARGLPRAQAEAFFTAQIAASRQVQTELLARWAGGEPLPSGAPLDLQTELRPRLDALTPRLLDALVAAHDNGDWPRVVAHARTRLSADGFSPETTRIALAPLETWAVADRSAEIRQRHQRRSQRMRPQLVN